MKGKNMDNRIASIIHRLNELVNAERGIKDDDPNREPRPQIRQLLSEAIKYGYGNHPKIESLTGAYL